MKIYGHVEFPKKNIFSDHKSTGNDHMLTRTNLEFWVLTMATTTTTTCGKKEIQKKSQWPLYISNNHTKKLMTINHTWFKVNDHFYEYMTVHTPIKVVALFAW